MMKGEDDTTTPRDTRLKAHHTARLETRNVSVNALRWFMRFSTNPVPDGATSTIVLVHGFAVSSLYMIPLARQLALSHHVYAPDLPGYGNTERPRRVLRLPELADSLIAWMDVVGIDGPVFVGNSYGAQIIVELALRHPQRISHGVLVGPTLDPSGGNFPRQVGRLLLDVTREPLSLWFIQTWDYLRFGPRRLVVTYLDMLRDPLRDKISGVTCPLLVTRGERDPIATEPWTRHLASSAPCGQHAVIPGAAHAANYSTPVTLAAIVNEFLAATAIPDRMEQPS